MPPGPLPRPGLHCCPVEVQGPFSQMLQSLRNVASSLTLVTLPQMPSLLTSRLTLLPAIGGHRDGIHHSPVHVMVDKLRGQLSHAHTLGTDSSLALPLPPPSRMELGNKLGVDVYSALLSAAADEEQDQLSLTQLSHLTALHSRQEAGPALPHSHPWGWLIHHSHI